MPEGQSRNRLRARLVGQFALLDFDEAERLIKTIAPERENDYMSQAYDLLYINPGKRDRDDLIRDALAAGAFRLKCAATRLAELNASDPDRALALFAAISNDFSDPPDKEDIAYLQSRIIEMGGVKNEIILAAIQKTKSKPEPPAAPKATPAKPEANSGLQPDISKIPYSDALERISKLKQPDDRASNLIQLSRRPDLTLAQQARVASEAFSAVGQMKISDDRLLGLSMLSRDFVKRHEYASAALAAQMLLETYNKACGCGAGTTRIWPWALPLGLSFYAFQSLTYTIDIYRCDAEPCTSHLTYLSAVSFFPTTLAGPITRLAVLLPQFQKPKLLDFKDGGRALFLIGLGLVKKLLIADYLAENLVNRVFDLPKLYSGTEVLTGVYAYAFQIYNDFSGYTDIAIGSALLLGVRSKPASPPVKWGYSWSHRVPLSGNFQDQPARSPIGWAWATLPLSMFLLRKRRVIVRRGPCQAARRKLRQHTYRRR